MSSKRSMNSATNSNDQAAFAPESSMVATDLSTINKADHGVEVAEVPFLTVLNLQAKAPNDEVMAAVVECVGLSLPQDANTAVFNAETSILWCGPTEWLIVSSNADASQWAKHLGEALSGASALVAEVTGGMAAIQIEGDNARRLMQKATTIDVHPSVFQPGSAALSVFAHTNAAFYQVNDAPCYRVLVRRSFADYLGHWLLDACAEFAA